MYKRGRLNSIKPKASTWVGRLMVLGVSTLVLACSSTPRPEAVNTAPRAEVAERFNWTSAFVQDVLLGDSQPAGVNLKQCTPAPGKSHVVLIHGTFSNAALSFGALAPRLINLGYCVHTPNYGAQKPSDWFKATRPVDESAREVAAFVDQVRSQHGANKVDLMGHSQGGLVGFYMLKQLNMAPKVNRFVALAPSVRGTTIAKTPNRGQVQMCQACADQHPASALLKALHADSPLVQGVKYSVVASANDKVVVPVESQFVRLPSVSNELIQDYFPNKSVSHSRMLYDSDSLELMIATLEGRQSELKKPAFSATAAVDRSEGLRSRSDETRGQ